MFYSLASSLGIHVDVRAKWAIDSLNLVNKRNTGNKTPQALRVRSVDDVKVSNLRKLEQGIYIGRSILVDAKYGARIEVAEDGAFVLSSAYPAMEWLMWLLHVAALRTGAAFVHGAAIERGGYVMLFPSWGGVGKTALVAGFIKEYGWRLLGDDLVIVKEDGSCHPFPKPMVLYPYHQTVFPEIFASGKGPMAPTIMNRWLTSAAIVVKPVLRRVPTLLAMARKHNPQSTRVSPEDVFGSAAISGGGRIGATIWLERLSGIEEPQLLSAGDTLASRIIGSTTNEYDSHCVRLTNVAMGLGMLHLDEYWTRWRRIVEGAVADKPQYVLNLPLNTPVADVPAAVRKAMNTAGLWDEIAAAT